MRSSLKSQARVAAEPYRRLELSTLVPMAAEPPWAETQHLQKKPRPRAAEPLEVSVPYWGQTPPPQTAEPLGVVCCPFSC